MAVIREAVRRDLKRIEWRHGVEAACAQASDRAYRAERQLAALTTGQGRGAGAAEADFTRALGAVYRDPAAARAAIEEQARTAGWSATLGEVRGTPATFGALHGHALGRLALDGGAREQAIAATPDLARAAGDHLAAQAALRQGRHEVAALTRAMHAGRDEARQLGAKLAGMPSERELLRRIGAQVRGLPREAVAGIQRGLTQVQHLAFGRALTLAKEAVLGRDDRGMER